MALYTKRRIAALTGVLAVALTATACGSDSTTETESTGSTDCAAFKSYGDLKGKTVTVYASIVAPEDQPHIDSYKPFEECTGATVEYQGSRDFEAQLPVRIKAGNAPDIAYIPQPGLLRTLVEQNPGKVIPAGPAATANVDKYYNPAWKTYGTVDDTFYAVPVGANAKSFVWYSPTAFKDAGYTVPTTWDEMMTLTAKIESEKGGDGLTKPWCAGIESGGATGWPATDWLEDLMLRTGSPEDYDKWVAHEIPFNDPKVVAALNQVGTILRDPKYVNGGLGDVKSIATTAFGDAGLPILDGTCYMMRQASFYQANWTEGTTIAEDGDVYAFYLPGTTAGTKPLLVGGEFAAAFADRPEVQAFLAYLASPEWSNEKAKVSSAGWLSANNELDPANLKSPIDQLSFELLTAKDTVVRFDGSDLMPGAVGAGSFWTGMTDWIALGTSSEEVLTAIEKSWPAS